MGKIKLSTVGKNALNHIQKTRDSLQSLKKSLLEREYRMNIRWRLSVVAIQLLILSTSTYITTGQFYSGATWFSAGLFSVVIGSQILEPFYSGPTDIIGNVVISILLWLTTEKEAAGAKKQTRFPHKSVPVQEKRENSELAPGPNALVSP